MEPIAAQQGISPSLRPTLSIHGDLAAVLQYGRVVAGEVMQKLDGGSLLLGVGNHRIAAQSGVELPIGKRFLAQVDKSGDGQVVLRLLGAGGGASEPKLVSALRGVVGQDRPVGELLKGLAQSLRSASAEPGNARLAKLAGQIEGHVFQPGSSGAELQTLIARSGMHYEAALLAYALKGSSGLSPGEELQALAKKLAGELALAASQVQGPLEPAAIGALGEQLRRQLEGFLRTRRGRGQGRAAIAAGLESALVQIVGGRSSDLNARIAQLISDSALLEVLAREDAGLSGNLKAQLLAALEGLPEGAGKTVLERALAGIESEQLLNVARKESSEGLHLSIPIPDGERWATAHLFYREGDEQSDREAGENMVRLTLAVDFSRLGPLRAELGITRDDLALSIAASREEIAVRLRTDLEALAESLAREGRTVRVSVRTGGQEELAADRLAHDVRWLRENHLLDCEG
jgi:flagellar hook-length control protein FliK